MTGNSVTTDGTTQNRTHAPAHELLTADGQNVVQDAKGNMTTIPANLRKSNSALNLTWDFDNRMSGADIDGDGTTDVTYQFDALGRRVGRIKGTYRRVYSHVGQQTVADYTRTNGSIHPNIRYVWGSYIDEPIVRLNPNGSRVYYHQNQQYSTYALTNATGQIIERYAYTAYGEQKVFAYTGASRQKSTYGIRHTYTGREWDSAIGLYHFRARMYDPISGRFCSRDPIGYVDGQSLFASYFAMHGGLDPNGARWFRPFAALVMFHSDGGGDFNDRVRDKCKTHLDQRSDPGSKHDQKDWPPELNSACNKAVARARIHNERVRKQEQQLLGNGCAVNIVCECCDGKYSLGGYWGYEKPIGNGRGKIIGRLRICANNVDPGEIAGILEHELVHANQHCYGRNWGRQCPLSLKREMEAYYCGGDCNDARSCLMRALASSCKNVPGFCDTSGGISDPVIAELIDWFDTYRNQLCNFPRPGIPRTSPRGEFPRPIDPSPSINRNRRL